MKRRSLAYVILSLILALGWMGFQTWQSIHRYQEHYVHGESEEHGSCQMCEWEVPLVELSETFELDFITIQIPIVGVADFVVSLFDSVVLCASGRGPPFIVA